MGQYQIMGFSVQHSAAGFKILYQNSELKPDMQSEGIGEINNERVAENVQIAQYAQFSILIHVTQLLLHSLSGLFT